MILRLARFAASMAAAGLADVSFGRAPVLTVDQPSQWSRPKPGEQTSSFAFHLSNTGDREIVVSGVNTSCGCTVARLPRQPWTLAPGESGDVKVVVDLSGKTGTVVKTATVTTSIGPVTLTMGIVLPAPPLDAATRMQNARIAQSNRQAVFQGDCAKCHVPPPGSAGESLYHAACGICHDAEHRATMVPDLRRFAAGASRDAWRTVIVAGKAGTLMPGFSADMDGTLTKLQIDTLVEYLLVTGRPEPRPSVSLP